VSQAFQARLVEVKKESSDARDQQFTDIAEVHSTRLPRSAVLIYILQS
jgi:hypothetical protein